jgi:hypothetical protein
MRTRPPSPLAAVSRPTYISFMRSEAPALLPILRSQHLAQIADEAAKALTTAGKIIDAVARLLPTSGSSKRAVNARTSS